MKIYTIHNMRDIDLRLSPRRLGPVTIKAKEFVKLSLDDDAAKAFKNTAGIKVKKVELEKPPEKPKKKKKRVAAGSSPAEVEAAKIEEKNKP